MLFKDFFKISALCVGSSQFCLTFLEHSQWNTQAIISESTGLLPKRSREVNNLPGSSDQSLVCRLLGLGPVMTLSCKKHLDAARCCESTLTLTAGVNMVAACLAIILCEKYRNESENIPTTCSPLSPLKQV